MKKLIVLVFAVFFVIGLKAQIWCPPGAQWHYRIFSPIFSWYYDGYLQLNNTGTVTVNSKICNNIVGTYSGIYGYMFGPTVTINNYADIQTYENNNVVYIYNNNTLVFDTMANFNASIGDKWLAINYPTPTTFTCNYIRPKINVIDTGHVIINNQNLKKLILTIQLYGNTYTTTIIQKISCITGFLFPFYDCSIDGRNFGNFICYSDNNFALYNPSGIACNYNTVGLNEFNEIENLKKIKIYPNPATNFCTLNLSELSNFKTVTLEVKNTLGQIIFKTNTNESDYNLNITSFNNGLYFITVTQNNKLLKETKLVIMK